MKPVERGNIKYVPFDPDDWALTQSATEAVQRIFQDSKEQTDEAIRWYTAAKNAKARLSSWLRGLAIFAGVLGGLAPIFASMVPALPPDSTANEPSLQLIVTQAGYVAVGIAGGLILFDRFFGLSSGWIRYMTAMTAIERLRLEFVLDWAKLRKEAPSNPDVIKLLDRVVVFRKALYQIIEDETGKWAIEFQAAMNDLDKYLKDTREKAQATVEEMRKQQDAPKTGSINLTLAQEWQDEVKVTVDGKLFETTVGRAVGIPDLMPGNRRIAVDGSKNGKPSPASVIVPLKAGEIVTLAM